MASKKSAKVASPNGSSTYTAVPWHLEQMVEKFADAATHITATLATHTQRLDSHDALAIRIQEDLRDLRKQQSQDTATLNQRIDLVRADLSDRLDTQTKDLTDHFDNSMQSIKDERKADSTRLQSLEKARWMWLGGTAVVGFILLELIRVFREPIQQFVVHYLSH